MEDKRKQNRESVYTYKQDFFTDVELLSLELCGDCDPRVQNATGLDAIWGCSKDIIKKGPLGIHFLEGTPYGRFTERYLEGTLKGTR